MWLLSVTKSQVWLGSRCVKFGVIALWSLEVQAGTSLQRTLRGSVKKIVTLHKDGVCQNPETELQHGGQSRPYSGLTGQVPFRTGLAMVDQKSWVHVLSIISRGCVWEIDVWVLPALLQRLKGWGISLSVLRPYAAHCIKLVCTAVVSEGSLLKMMHKKAHKQLAEDK